MTRSMQQQFLSFLVRWVLNSVGLWVSVLLFGTGHTEVPTGLAVFALAGLIFSIVNAILKPIIIIFSLPALLVTLGLFMFVVNGFMVYLSVAITPGLSMTFWRAILAGAVIALVNYIVSNLIDVPTSHGREETNQ